ncbi:MAG: 50S ribosomal protein L17 [Candidatus Zixiibacteriota bacterium]|nr:MAG: 50S ribosomal protein L17 [candidate division Zixibacteria bacterium]
MRHQVKTKKLSRTKSHREAMLANMATSLLDNRTITTTETKAKELRRVVDRLIAIAKDDSLQARRQVGRTIKNKNVVKKLFADIAPQFRDRPSGFTRVMRIGFRRGDSAAISMVELLTAKPKSEKEKEKKKEKAAAKKK